MVSSFMPSLLSGQNGQTYTDTFRAGELLSKDITLTFTNGLLTGHQVK